MDIHKRINARKLMLSYLYHYCFLQKLSSEVNRANTDPNWVVESWKDPFFDQNFLVDLQDLWEKSSKQGEIFHKKITEMINETDKADEIPYYLKNFFDQRKDGDVDGEYLVLITEKFSKYVLEIKDLVNSKASSFKYEEMEVCNQAIFLLWYTEFQILKTPKAVIINEMVELAKRYSSEEAPKVIHAIFDKIL